LVISGLLFGLMLSMINTRSRAKTLAEKLTQEIREREILLEESEFRWKFAIEGSGDGVWDRDISKEYSFYSKQWKAMLGYAEDDIMPQPDEWLNRIHPDDCSRVTQAMQAYVGGDSKNYAEEFRMQCKDGSYKWILSRGMVVSRNEDGKPIRMIGTHSDITERKEFSAKLQQSEQHFRFVTESAQALIWMADQEKRCVWFNKVWLDFTGRTHEQEFGNGWVEGVHQDDVSRCWEIYASNFDLRQAFQMEYRLKRYDGQYRWILDFGNPYFDVEGNFEGYIGSCFDITDRKENEIALKKSEERYSALFTDSSMPKLLIDPSDGRIVDANDQSRTFYGWDIETLKKMNIGEINTLNFVQLVEKMMLAFQNKQRQFFFQHRTANGDVREVEVFSGPITVGEKTLILSSIHDITERRMAEQALRESESRYSTMFSQNTVPMLMIDPANGRIIDANISGSLFLGWDIPSLLSMKIFDINSLDPVILMAGFERAMQSAQTNFIFDVIHASGKTIASEIFAGPITIDGKNLLLCSAHDITERRKAEHALRESEALNTSVLDSLVEHIAVLDANGTIISVNRAWLQFALANDATGVREKWIGINYLSVCGSSHHQMNNTEAASAQDGIRSVLSGKLSHFDMEYACHSPDEERWFVMHVTPLQGTQAGAVVAHENITLRKKTEIEIQTSHVQLEEMSSRLIDTQELERKNIARELHDALGQRFAILNINLHTIRQSLSGPEAERVWQRASEDVTALIGQMRSISKSLRPPALDYLGLETSIQQLLQQHFSGTLIKYHLEYAGLPAKLSEQIEITVYRIIQESITNIVRHADASHVIVEINGGEKGEEIEIIIRDNGKGFDVTSRDGKERDSLSYGLIGMRERAKLMGGTFTAESNFEQGTRITVSLPL
jgi:PAS domain S-box-containing protein